jgi:hypothetical protein
MIEDCIYAQPFESVLYFDTATTVRRTLVMSLNGSRTVPQIPHSWCGERHRRSMPTQYNANTGYKDETGYIADSPGHTHRPNVCVVKGTNQIKNATSAPDAGSHATKNPLPSLSFPPTISFCYGVAN